MEREEKRLEKHGVRPTSMRILILKRLEKTSAATSLADLESELETSERSTLYRTMKKFEEVGIVHQIQDGTGISKYALCEDSCNCEIEKDLHLHFHCSHCKETICLTNYKIPKISLPKGYVVEDINLVIKGICDKCKTD